MKRHPKTITLRFAKENLETFEMIKSGEKRVETRAATIKYQDIQKGDVVTLSCAGKKFKKIIKKVTHFKTLSALFKKYNQNKIHPGIGSVKKMVAQYHSFHGYEQKIKEFGLLAFELE